MHEDIPHDVLVSVARAATNRPDGSVECAHLAPAAHRVENMTTHRLDRLTGVLTDGTPFSVFVKCLHPASESLVWPFVPEEHRAVVLEELDWLDEPRLYRSPLATDLPNGLRLPAIFRIDEAVARVTIWMEDVPDHESWDVDRYHRAAVALGRLAGHWPEARATSVLGVRRRPLVRLFHGKITHLDLSTQADDRFWAAPEVAAVVDDRHRADLEALAAAMPRQLGRLERLPHALGHGDATPDNLREPGDGSTVAIDWSYAGAAPVGSDLGQLLVGRVESGAVDPCSLGDIADAILDGYLAGVAEAGGRVERRAVEEAWATHLAVRSLFSALLLDHRPDLDDAERQALLARRATMARFGLDLAARVLDLG